MYLQVINFYHGYLTESFRENIFKFVAIPRDLDALHLRSNLI